MMPDEAWVGRSDRFSGANDLDVDAHRDDGKRFIVRTQEILAAFSESERAIHEFAADLMAHPDPSK